MSVPLPSSPLPPHKSGGRSRPQPISTGSNPSQPLSNPNQSPSSPSSSSFKKNNLGGGGGGGGGDNWRDRSSGNVTGGGNGGSGGNVKSAVRTVGGFEKRGGEAVSPGGFKSAGGRKDGGGGGGGGAGGGVRSGNGGGQGGAAGDKGGNGDDEEVDSKAAALAHVPCRFYKAGSCTAGNNCPFSHEEGGKREICQWFLKGNCKFGHKCALAHVRPGEPMSMDRKNKKEAQREAKGERSEPTNRPIHFPSHPPPQHQYQQQEPIATPVPIRSALSSSLQSPPAHRLPSSPLREPFGPPSNNGASPGFGRPSPSGGLHGFASSPSRPSPLSSSFNGARTSVPGPAAASLRSPLRPPTTAFSSSFSHSTLSPDHRSGPAPPLSASFADNSGMRKSIWARSETPAEPLSPRNRPLLPQSQSHPLFHVRRPTGDVFLDDEDDEHGQDLLPSSLMDDVLLPTERARRLSRRDSQESYSVSPSRHAFAPHAGWNGGERLAQSAGPTPGFLQGLWSAEGGDLRKSDHHQQQNLSTLQVGVTPPPRSSLLSSQRSPISPPGVTGYDAFGGVGGGGGGVYKAGSPTLVDNSFMMRGFGGPSSPSARALMEHEPGMSLPGGLASALSRLHMQGSGRFSELGQGKEGESEREGGGAGKVPMPGVGSGTGKKDEHDDDGIFSMDG